VQEGLKLIPSVTRVFNTSRPMYVFLQAYAGGASTTAPPPPANKLASPLVGFVSLYRDGKRAFESAPQAVTPDAASRLGTAPFSFQIGLTDVAPGQYQCQVTVLDPSGNRVAFWVNPIMLVR
jgi:hypothetical protein